MSPRPLADVADALGLAHDRLVPHGHDKAKITAAATPPPTGRQILVSAITPTPAGEGKTTVGIALTDALRQRGHRVCLTLRQPSLGPFLGAKGGGSGGGAARVVPTDDLDLHFTGDLHAVGSAHNLLAALLDHHLHRGNALGIEARTLRWPRVVDVDDRALRHVIVGLGGRQDGVPRETGFQITAASEVMAVLAMARDACDVAQRLGRMVLGRRAGGVALTPVDLEAVGALQVLLRDAVLPTLVQTAEGAPVLVHTGPFANVAHGTSSVIASRLALAHADLVVTEAGFGFDLGGEKLLDLVAPAVGQAPSACVLVVTVRALRHHGDGDLAAGLPQLLHHATTARAAGLPVVVALNRFADDTDAELAEVTALARAADLPLAVCAPFTEGGAGTLALADQVLAHLGAPVAPSPFQDPTASVVDNLERLARTVHAADGVVLTPQARHDLAELEALGLAHGPVCLAKTAASLSDDPHLRGVPTGRPLTIRALEPRAGAGWVVAVAGSLELMPGMPAVPRATRLGLDADGRVTDRGT
ncbi:MAG: formate--tetrahydrofolate ligase [Alphaproteobacteria bacterium]|nr:formate--tetrahydrofolate ligase [Alphaproteobacteria bacterium]